jgi:hypothetical protein
MRTGRCIALAVAAAAVTGAPAVVAAAQPGDADQTIAKLESEGYEVIVDRVGNGPTSQCTVTSVRNPQIQTRQVGVGSKPRETITVVTLRTINVTLNCSA